jgi:hypothetical protein
MITSITQTIITTENGAGIGDDVAVSDRRREVVLSVPAQHRVTLELLGKSLELEIRPTDESGAVDWNNPDREILRTHFYSASADVIASAIVQYVARKHGTTESKFCSDNEKAESVEILRRIAGAMGLTYGDARVLLPGEA